MHLLKTLRAGLSIAVAMLGLLAVAAFTFALAVWAAAVTVLP